MNKTININLGGVFFHIDESAYLKLKRYLDTIRLSLSDEPLGRDEILNDIETRIGELLSEKIKDVRQVVNEGDIDEIINIMGKPEDYVVDEDLFYETETTTRRSARKLYRDGEDKFLGGVASGMAHYFDVDVIWIRIAWLILIFGFGFGILPYIIFWILLPEAKTTAEKLEMMGEPVNISNIEKKIKEELSTATDKIKNGISDVSEKMKNADYQKYGEKAKSGFQEMLDVIGKIVGMLFKILGKFIGVLIIFISVVVIVSLFIGLFTVGSLGFINEDWFYSNGMTFHHLTTLPIWIESIVIFLLVAIPFFFLFLLGMKILSPTAKLLGRVTKQSLFGVWLVALLVTIFMGIKMFMYRAFDGTVIENRELTAVTSDTLQIKMIDNPGLTGHTELRRRWGRHKIVLVDGQEVAYSNNLRLSILPSDSDKIFIKVRKRSKGKSTEDAREKASDMEYSYGLVDSQLQLNGYFLSEPDERFLEQNIYVDVYLPVGQIIYIDRSTRTFLYDVKTKKTMYELEMPKHYYKMTEDGLECLDCDVPDENEAAMAKPESFKLNIDEKGLDIQVTDKHKEKARVKIDENGVHIETIKDTNR